MELLSPAGDREALVAAIRNGADAVYLGGQALNARRGAGNFDADGLCWASDYCHERGKKLYVTVNTLVKQSELPILERIAGQLAKAGVDAAILQDLGAAQALSQMLPSLPRFASTQMAIHNRHGVRFLLEAGFARAVLAREMDYGEIADCAKEGLPLEVFCHGALCVSCSGQCLFSSMVGGRSGNRGMCAQPCRLPYEIHGPLLEASGHLLSPRDLMMLGELSALQRAGAHSLKIEGRLKRAEYVAIVTRIYRHALDNGFAWTEKDVAALRQIFNRGGFTQGYGPGLIDHALMYDAQPNHVGVTVGRIAHGQRQFEVPVSDKDQILEQEGLLIRLADDEQLRAARATYEGVEQPGVALSGEVTVINGQPLLMRVSDGSADLTIRLDTLAQPAQSKALDADRVRAQLEKTGGTPYCFEALMINLSPDTFAPASWLNELRRTALDALSKRRIECNRGCGRTLQPMETPVVRAMPPVRPRLTVQADDVSLLELTADWGAEEIIYAPSDLTNLTAPSKPFSLALPVVCSEPDLENLHSFALANRDAITAVLLANPAHLALDWPGAVRADYPMNVANDCTVSALSMPYAPSVELTAQEIAQLGGEKELVVYGRLPLMQLRHCPLNARLGKGKHIDCRRCDHLKDGLNAHALTDRKGVRFPLQRMKTDKGCIVRVLNSVPLMLLRHIGRLPQASAWRLILTGESRDIAESIVRLHRAALDGQDIRQRSEWALVESMETTTGHYFRGVE